MDKNVNKHLIEMINDVIAEAITHGGDIGGAYYTNAEGLARAMFDLRNWLGLKGEVGILNDDGCELRYYLIRHVQEEPEADKAIINFQKNASEDYNAQHRAGFCPNCEKTHVFRTTADYGYCPDCGHPLVLFRPEGLLRRAAERMAEELEPAAQAVIDSMKGDGDDIQR